MTTPFYGADATLFAGDRGASSQPGRVIAELDLRLPNGLVLDVTAGDGFTAQALSTARRTVLPVETDPHRRTGCVLPLLAARPQRLPFRDRSLTGGYAVLQPGEAELDQSSLVAELNRTVRRGGPLVMVATLDHAEAEDPLRWWTTHGFECEIVDTAFSSEHPYRFGVLTAPSLGS